MSSFSIGEHKSDIATLAAGGVIGSAIGNSAYAITPDRLAKYTIEGGRKIPHITNRFIHYAQRVSEKDIMENIDPHTKRSWVRQTMHIIKNRAAKARNNIMGDERWEFQKIYNLGKKYLTQRSEVPKTDLGLARRGANAILYGTKMEKTKSTIIGGVMGAAAALLIKTGLKKYNEYKKEETLKKQHTLTFETMKD